jgi:hypothetical protein
MKAASTLNKNEHGTRISATHKPNEPPGSKKSKFHIYSVTLWEHRGEKRREGKE